ncbi:DUF2232 domain-containing protein [Salinarimonas ramus]|uniref:Membrane protein n=1 Tax=Salinarimonas ramus TaxID=690164 RepID=A0A917QCA7_9HYPH|nr:DUF2232 domain-containing protein [Salinarimonas ramus]GGK43320.1 membrane protein [Salinarimonas ramus]
MSHFIPIGIGAGLVSALLTATVTQGSAIALVLYLLAPIPILVAALGWDHRAGLVGAAVGGIALSITLEPVSGLGFAVASGLPAWWLAYLVLLGRAAPDGTMEWYPLGRLLAWIAGVAALTFLAAAAVPDFDYALYEMRVREATDALFSAQPPPPGAEVDADTLAGMVASLAPVFAAQGFTVILVLYVWLGAKIVQISGRLARPWPDVPSTLMPREAVYAFLGAVVVANLAGGFVGVFAGALTGAFVMAFALQGLAAIHDVSRGRPGRVFLLFGTYTLILFSQGLILVAMLLFGIADSAFGIRRRFFSGRPPTITRKPPKE